MLLHPEKTDDSGKGTVSSASASSLCEPGSHLSLDHGGTWGDSSRGSGCGDGLEFLRFSPSEGKCSPPSPSVVLIDFGMAYANAAPQARDLEMHALHNLLTGPA